MKITLDEVRHVAHLAHLRLADAELEHLRLQLDAILVYIDKLGELPTDGVESMAGGATSLIAPLRQDVLQPTLPPETALSNAPESGRGHFVVPKVIG